MKPTNQASRPITKSFNLNHLLDIIPHRLVRCDFNPQQIIYNDIGRRIFSVSLVSEGAATPADGSPAVGWRALSQKASGYGMNNALVWINIEQKF